MGFPTQSRQSAHPCRTQETPAVAMWAQPSVLSSDAVRPHGSSAVEPRGGVACGGVCGMKPACAFGDSSRFHFKDKKGRHEGNDIYVLGKPSCSKLPQRRERGTWAVPPPPPGWGASAGPPAWQQGRLHPSAQGHPHLHLPQDGNTSLCAHRNRERKTASGREGVLRFTPGVMLEAA